MIRLIVGLGNPGQQYEKTRHNAGFIFLDHLAYVRNIAWSSSGQFQGEVANLVLGADKIVLLKPMTFMNRSGVSVGSIMRYFKFKPEEMLVVHDELDLPEGVVKMKRDGGHAGHNGLRDIIAHIGTRDFYRMRVGIGRPVGGSVADYVLSKPSNSAAGLFDNVFRSLEQKMELLLVGDVASVNNYIGR